MSKSFLVLFFKKEPLCRAASLGLAYWHGGFGAVRYL
jgi:hypothetical protein